MNDFQGRSDVSMADEDLKRLTVTKLPLMRQFSFRSCGNRPKLYHPDYKQSLDKSKFSPGLISNSEAKQIVKPKRVKTKIGTPEKESSGRTPKKSRKKDNWQSVPSVER